MTTIQNPRMMDSYCVDTTSPPIESGKMIENLSKETIRLSNRVTHRASQLTLLTTINEDDGGTKDIDDIINHFS